MKKSIEIKFGARGTATAAAAIRSLSSGIRGLGNAASKAAKAGLKALSYGITGLGASALAGVYALQRGVRASLDYGAEMHKLSNTLGISAGEVAVLSQAFRENGMEANMVTSMLPKMQRKIAENSEAFKALGLSTKALQGRSAVEQFNALGEAVRGVTSQESKMLALMQIFEEAGPQMMQLFNNKDAFSGARKTLGAEAELLAANAAAMERASTLLGNVSVKLRGFFSGVAVGVLNPLLRAMEAFNGLDFAKYGTQFGEALGKPLNAAIQAFKEGRLGEFLATELEWAVSKMRDSLAHAFSDSGIGRQLISVFANLGTVFGQSVMAAVSPDALNLVNNSGRWLGAAAYSLQSGDFSHVARFQEETNFFERKVDTDSLENALSGLGAAVARLGPAAMETAEAESEATRRLRERRDALRSEFNSRAPDSIAQYSAPVVGAERASASAASEASSAPKKQHNSLARIGGYLGGTSSPATSAAMRTARNTDRTASFTEKMSRSLETIAGSLRSGPATAVYA